MRDLLERGVDPNTKGNRGVPAINLAAQSGSPEAVRALLRWGADPNIAVPRPNKKFVTPFETAATFGHIGCMAVLVEGGVPVNGFRLTGRRALHLATLAGELDAVIWLLAHGADPNQRELTIGPFRWLTKTPAMVAASVGSVSILERLETAGARFGDVYWHRSGRYTALRFAKLFKRDDATRFLEVRVV